MRFRLLLSRSISSTFERGATRLYSPPAMRSAAPLTRPSGRSARLTVSLSINASNASAAKQPAPKAFKLDAQGAQVADVVGKAVAAKPNAVLLGTAGDITATLVNEFKKVSPSTPLAATSVALSGDNLRQLGGKASGIALSMVLPDAARTSYAVVRDYQ